MCGLGTGLYGTPTGGIPLPPEIHEQLPADVKEAFKIFDRWFKNRKRSRKMPLEVKQSLETIKKAKIPGRSDGMTCASSCYVVGVEKALKKK